MCVAAARLGFPNKSKQRHFYCFPRDKEMASHTTTAPLYKPGSAQWCRARKSKGIQTGKEETVVETMEESYLSTAKMIISA